MKEFAKHLLGLCPPALHWARNVRAMYQARRAGADPYLWFAPPGHYYSPIPRRADEPGEHDRRPGRDLPGIDLRAPEQEARWRELTPEFAALSLVVDPDPTRRYHLGNPFFGPGEAQVLGAMFRRHPPRRVTEIGCGYSSALLLDLADTAPGGGPEFTFIDPDPVRLRDRLRPADFERHRFIEGLAQQQPVSRFETLEAGDWLFIDSSHVAKAGSDVLFLFLEILPRLRPGVWVHVHDIFWPFDYPASMYHEGRAWNEAFFLRAFLCHNPAWPIRFWNDWFWRHHPDLVGAALPGAQGLGASLWLQRV